MVGLQSAICFAALEVGAERRCQRVMVVK